MKAVLDTNVLVYDTFEDSVYHEQAKELMDNLDRWIIPAIVIHEYVWVLKSLNVEPENVRDKVEEYISHQKTRIVSDNHKDILFALKILVEENLSISRYNDKVILSIALRENLSLASFDKKLRSQAKSIGVDVIP